MDATTSVTSTARPAPRPRNPGLRFEEEIPRDWFAGSRGASAMVNAVNLLFPWGERFFVRSVRRYLDHPAVQADPVLVEAARGFAGQEGRHAQAHERFFAVMEAQGYEIRTFLRWYERISEQWIEKNASPELRLATTAAAEHFTAMMAYGALAFRFFDESHPTMRRLLMWHAAEEVEHKAVAFDVLKRVDPSYGLRMRGLAVATITLGGFWLAAIATLLKQEPDPWKALTDLRMRQKARPRSLIRDVFLKGILEYARPSFHPLDKTDDLELARAYLREAGFEEEPARAAVPA